MKQYVILLLMALGVGVVAFAAESISITATPRYPWNGKVDLKFTIDGTSGTKYDTSFTVKDVAGGTNLTMKTLYKSNGTVANVAKEQLLPGTYNWVWDATADLGEGTVLDRVVVEGCVVSGGIQLWKDGPYWAECNVGAKKPEEYGYYFWWGDTVGYVRSGGTWTSSYTGYKDVTWVSSEGARMSTSPFRDSCATYGKSDSQLQSVGYIDLTGNLVPAHDAATVHLGATWRLPTSQELDDLMSKCTWVWTMSNGVKGYRVTGKDGYSLKSIFLPAGGISNGTGLFFPGSAGYYWSSTPNSDNSGRAWDLFFGSSEFYRDHCDRYFGRSVRPVREFVE